MNNKINKKAIRVGTRLMCNDHVPKNNIQVFCYLYEIETSLRELVIEALENIEGSRWYKKRLPGDILGKYRDAIEHERNIKWTQLIPHHPIYYIDFSDLKKIITRTDNWNDAFKVFFSRNEMLNSLISELEPIRNKIAHNRKVSKKDVEIVKGLYAKLTESIGKQKFTGLVKRVTVTKDILERIVDLKTGTEEIFNSCKNIKPVVELDKYVSILNAWWFDESYLGCEVNEIITFYATIKEYVNLPRNRGSGHKIERWLDTTSIDDKYKHAQSQLLKMVKMWNRNGGLE